MYEDMLRSRLALYVDGALVEDVFGVLTRRVSGAAPDDEKLTGLLGLFTPWPRSVTSRTSFWVRSVVRPDEWLTPVTVHVVRPAEAPLKGSLAAVEFAVLPATPTCDMGSDRPPFQDLDGAWVAAQRVSWGPAYDQPLAALAQAGGPPGVASPPRAFTQRTIDGFTDSVSGWRLCKLWGGCD